MKTLKTLMLFMAVMVSAMSFTSCNDDDGYSLDNFQYGIVTIKPTSNDSYFFQLDDNTTLWPVNITKPKVEKESRALIGFTLLSDSISGYSHAIKLISMDSILTKSINENLGSKNDSIYGTDPIEFVRNGVWGKEGIWIEDGYLTVYFSAAFGGQTKHFLNLIPASDSTNPYELEFRHNAYDDPKQAEQKGLVSFKLDKLPSTNGETVKLTVNYNSNEGKKSVVLDYKTKE